MVEITQKDIDRFWSKVRFTLTCWFWIPSGDRNVYGCFGYGGHYGVQLGPHVFAWIVTNGPVPEGLSVLHTCDIKRCVRPAHLWVGTQADNIRDMIQKGRRAPLPPPPPQLGMINVNAKLTPDQVREMRRMYDNREAGTPTIGRLFGVSTATAHKVVKRQAWTHI